MKKFIKNEDLNTKYRPILKVFVVRECSLLTTATFSQTSTPLPRTPLKKVSRDEIISVKIN